jgi:hypothetical protein
MTTKSAKVTPASNAATFVLIKYNSMDQGPVGELDSLKLSSNGLGTKP